MEELLSQFGQYGLAGLIVAVLLWMKWNDDKAFRAHLEQDRLREEALRQQAEEDRDKMIEVIVNNNQVMGEMKQSVDISNARSGKDR